MNEDIGKIPHPHHDHHKNKSDELLDSLKQSPKYQKDISCLGNVFFALFGTQYLGNYCCYTNERQECDDGSDLYTMIKYEGKDLIVKVGAGEFNTKVFTTGNIQELKGFYHSPIPLFVVNQSHSCMYLPHKNHRDMSEKEPKRYLDKYASIVSPKGGEAYFRLNKERSEEQGIDYTHIHIRHYDDVLAIGRLALLQKEFPNGQFIIAINLLKQLKALDFEKFYARTYKGEKFSSEEEKRLIGCLRRMGISTVGSGIGDRDAYQSLYDLVQTFDSHKHIFKT